MHEADFLITATGFDLFSEPASYKRGRVTGAGGRDLGDFFNTRGMQAYESVSITGFKYYFTELNRGVRSYWKNADDDVPLLRPTTTLQARRAAKKFPADDYEYAQQSQRVDSTVVLNDSQVVV
ncbi:Probable monooxygenase [Mycobacteroides abscessus subsp. massiliense]|nr:Probable monooxygenase [Mycobacteroides abscessus subsp. massiliense]